MQPQPESDDVGLGSLVISQLQFVWRLCGPGDDVQRWDVIAGSDADSANINALSQVVDAVPVREQGRKGRSVPNMSSSN